MSNNEENASNDVLYEKAPKKKRIFDKGTMIIVLLVFVLVGSAAGVGFWVGNLYGQRAGTRNAVSKVTDLINPINAISNNAAFPYTVIGKVSSIGSNEITVKLPNGDEKKVAVSSKTKVSQGSEVKTLNDVKKDANITVFTTGSGSDQIANRVIIR